MRRNFNRSVSELGLTQAQWQALAHISRREGLSQAALADLIEVQPITVARLIDRMVASGWVERRPDPSDRRAVQLFLMPKAEPILDEMWARAARLRGETLTGITDAERDTLLDILTRMRTNICNLEEKP
jgi:DNA-binding MarR family transcriptional regulator